MCTDVTVVFQPIPSRPFNLIWILRTQVGLAIVVAEVKSLCRNSNPYLYNLFSRQLLFHIASVRHNTTRKVDSYCTSITLCCFHTKVTASLANSILVDQLNADCPINCVGNSLVVTSETELKLLWNTTVEKSGEMWNSNYLANRVMFHETYKLQPTSV